MRRKNPLSAVEQLRVRELRAGDVDAFHEVVGVTELDGDIDAFVLRVKENAAVERLLLVGRLEVGAQARPPEGSGASPYASGASGSSAPSGGTPYAPRADREGASIDEDGTLRTAGWVVIHNSEYGLVLRSPEGRYFGFTVDEHGALSVQGKDLGTSEP